jgi:hypothetical protein
MLLVEKCGTHGEHVMKLVNRKTRKAIKKSVRKAMKKHGPALVAGLASSLASTLATLAKTEAPGKRGKSNLAEVVDRVEDTLTGDGAGKSRDDRRQKKTKHRTPDSTVQTDLS